MKLSVFERMVLANQYIIMLKLCGNEGYLDAKWAKDKLDAVWSGYEMHYEHDAINEGAMSVQDSGKVIDTLNMYRAFHQAFRDHGEPTKDSLWLTFQGYDGNDEITEMSYAEYYCNQDGGRFQEQNITDFNSHRPCKDSYERMVTEWKADGYGRDLTLADVERIIAVA